MFTTIILAIGVFIYVAAPEELRERLNESLADFCKGPGVVILILFFLMLLAAIMGG